MTDLESRIIGSRLMQAGRSPYFYHRQASENLNLLDPTVLLPHDLTGVTTTPFFLWLLQPLAKTNYCNIKFAWWLLEELLLFSTMVLTCLVPAKFGKQCLAIILCSIFFCYSRNWYQHVYSGQYYILFAFVFALIIWFTQKQKKTAMVIFPVITLVRPFFALASLPWLLRKEILKPHFTYLASGIVLSIMLFVLSGTIKWMPEFAKAMKYYNSEVIGWQQKGIEKDAKINFTKIENCITGTGPIRSFQGGCLFSVQHYLKLLGVRSDHPVMFSALLLLVLFFFIYLTQSRRITRTADHLLLASFIIYILCELFTPANRNPYNMVQYLGVMGLVVNAGNKTIITLLVAGLAFNHDFPLRFAYQREIGEVLILLSGFLVFFKRDTMAINNKSAA